MAHRIRTRPRNGPGAKPGTLLRKQRATLYAIRVWDFPRRWSWYSSTPLSADYEMALTEKFVSRIAALRMARSLRKGYRGVQIVPLHMTAEWIEDKEP